MTTAAGNLRVADTGTGKGRGVFATTAIASGSVVEEAPVVILTTKHSELAEEIQNITFDWGYLVDGSSHQDAIALGYGSLYNNDNPANMRYEAVAARQVIRFIAVRDISAGEELTINYSALGGGAEWKDDSWFDRIGRTPLSNHK